MLLWSYMPSWSRMVSSALADPAALLFFTNEFCSSSLEFVHECKLRDASLRQVTKRVAVGYTAHLAACLPSLLRRCLPDAVRF